MRINFAAPMEPQPWKRHFLWFPKFIDHELLWLEWVERKMIYPYKPSRFESYYRYRLIEPKAGYTA